MSHVNTSDAEQGSTPLKSNQVKERRPARQSSVFSTKRQQVSSATGPTRSQKRKRTELDTAENSLEPNSDLDSESNPDVAVMDITQDSDCDNTKMKPGAKKTRGPAVTEFDDVEMYFESPVPAKGDKNGLEAIELKTKGLVPVKHETLGFVPGLKTIDEERSGSEPNTTKKLFNSDDGEPPANTGCGDDESDNESSNGDHPQVDETAPATSISQILQNVDYVIQRITSSAAKRSEFAVWGKRLEYDGQSLIAGYGIRWNIKWQSRDCAYEAREVITKLLELEQSRHNREGGTHFFQEVEIRWSDWEMVKKLNDILREFYFITKKMEGDHSSGSRMLAEYQYIKQFLRSRLTHSLEPEFQAMIRKMVEKTNTYMNEALQCDSILLATMLHPLWNYSLGGVRAWRGNRQLVKGDEERNDGGSIGITTPSYRLSIFQMRFSTHHTYAQSLLQTMFNKRKEELQGQAGLSRNTPPAPTHTPVHKNRRAVAEDDYFPEPDATPVKDELAIYLGGIYRLPVDQADECLDWWKDHQHEFPVLASIAKDYMACSATSASVEHCFSAAANTCGRDQGSLAARTIERCVNSHQWLRQGFQADKDFDTAQRIINCATGGVEGSYIPLTECSSSDLDSESDN
ncbi:hypothetical protein MJO28_004922 [Puccinia striiformis f. sp. tritici]|uniref:Uncharacterized protein n=1 Tax=Puccinia striiformis f. sp. tritici TaxID=168172 RepID=A0ACC0EKH5_9BASI|nr:hypothetical protein MJO28_004922 [Puccinia striiformis f. sp. tritici]